MLVSCGPTAKEKEEIAILTCNILESSVVKDGVFRLNEVNDAREEIGKDRFLGTDNVIRESLKVGLCKELVLNEKNYEIEIKDVLFFRPTLEEQTYISDYLQKKYSALDGALGS